MSKTENLRAAAAVRVLSVLALTVAAPLAVPSAAASQSPVVSSRATGLGGVAFDALACGADALAANPAALARRCDSPVRILILPTVSLEAADNGAGAEVWRHRQALMDAFDQESFADAFDPVVREEILASIPSEGYHHRTRIHLPFAQAGLGQRTAFSLTFTGHNSGRITRDLAELALRGYEDGRSFYNIQGTDETVTGYWTLAFGHGRRFGGTDVGVTGRLISGTFMTRWQAFDAVIGIPQQRVTGTVIGAFAGENLFTGNLIDFRPPDGFGWGLDVGAMREVGPVRVGVAIQNLLSAMSWSDDTHLRILTLEATTDGTEFRTDEVVYDPATATPRQREVVEALRDDPHFPTRLRASASFSPARMVTLGAGAVVNVGDGELDRDWDRRFSVGGEVRPLGFLRFQGGLSADLDGASELSGGVELDVFRSRLGVSAARISEPGAEPGWASVGGWRVVAGFSRF